MLAILAAPQLNFCFGPWPSQRPTCAEREQKLKWRKEQKKRIGAGSVEKKIVEGSLVVSVTKRARADGAF